jgi:hypothetical protein
MDTYFDAKLHQNIIKAIKKSCFPPEAAFFMQNTEGSKTHKRLIINPIIKRLFVKKAQILRGR